MPTIPKGMDGIESELVHVNARQPGPALLKALGIAAAMAMSGGLLAAAIQSPTGWWLGWLTLLPLMLAIRVLRPICALAAGVVWGASFFLLSLPGAVPLFDPSLRSFVLVVIVPAVYAGLGSSVTRRVGFSPLLLGLGWVGVEFALHPLALHNGLLAGALGDSLFMRVIGNVAGYFLLAFLVAYVTASLLTVLTVVCAAHGSLRYVPRAGAVTAKLRPREVTFDLLDYIRPLQARAPPTTA